MQSQPQRADVAEEALKNLGLELNEIVSDDTYDVPIGSEPRPRWFVPLLLLLATLISMTWAGIAAWSPMGLLENAFYSGSLFEVRRHVLANWLPGLLFSVSLTVILGAHELGAALLS